MSPPASKESVGTVTNKTQQLENKITKRNQAPSSLVQKQTTTTLKGINIKYKDMKKKSNKGEDRHPEKAYTMRKGRILLWA